MRCQWGEAEWGRTGKIQSFRKPAWCLGYLYRYICLSLLLYCWKEWTKRFATFESNIQKYNFCFHYLVRECGPSVEIVLGLVKCTYKFLNFFLFEFQKTHNGVSHFQNPSGKIIDVQWDIWLLPAQGLPVQECSNLPGKIKQYILERSCWNGTVSIRSW